MTTPEKARSGIACRACGAQVAVSPVGPDGALICFSCATTPDDQVARDTLLRLPADLRKRVHEVAREHGTTALAVVTELARRERCGGIDEQGNHFGCCDGPDA